MDWAVLLHAFVWVVRDDKGSTLIYCLIHNMPDLVDRENKKVIEWW